MEMVVRMGFMATPFTKGEVLLAVVRNYAVCNAVGAETIQDTVNRSPVYTVANSGQNLVVAKGRTRLFQDG